MVQIDVGYEKMLLSKTMFPRGDGYEKLTASIDVIQNAIAALFYEFMAVTRIRFLKLLKGHENE
jgi:hypothetical protein